MQYLNASKYVEERLKNIFNKVKSNVKISDSYILSIIKSADTGRLEELIRLAQARGSTELAEYLEKPEIKRQFKKLSELQEQIKQVTEGLCNAERKETGRALKDIAESSYNHSMFDIQKQTGLGFSFQSFDQKLYDNIIRSEWSGRNYSKRIWNRTQELADTLKSEMLQGFMCGKTYKEMAKVVQDKFSSSAINARRLVRTEGNYVANEFEMQSYKECGIEKYIFVATLDLRTSEKCADLDGKVFNVKDAVPGKNMPPLHPWCRSTTIAYVGEEALARMKRRARNPKTGKNEVVPANMTYDEWYKKYVSDASVKDRFGLITNNNKTSARYYDYKGKTMQRAEKELSKLNYEVAIGYRNGKPIFCQIQERDEHEVAFTRHQLSKMKDAEIIHNHIYGTPPSPEDLYLLVNNKCKSVRACSDRGTYIIRNGEYVNKLPKTLELFDEEYSKLYNSKCEKYYEMIRKSQISSVDAEIKLQEEVWEELKKKYDIDIKFEVKQHDTSN
ncbi:MAG: minor capsid protein [Lachnospiraceae bacterium]|nr:minor capsid protein [Lachnospiraceae bacterium]